MEAVLSPADVSSATWRRLVAHLHARLKTLREMNDSVHTSFERTQHIRGSIAECKRILALASVSASEEVVPAFGSED